MQTLMSPARTLKRYSRDIENALAGVSSSGAPHADHSALTGELLSGEVELRISKMLGRDARRASGVFFSGSTWADLLSSRLPSRQFGRYLDPACGIGDLLLSIARKQPVGSNLNATLKRWDQLFVGLDIDGSFASVARSRLIALAIARQVTGTSRRIKGGNSPRPRPGVDSLSSGWNINSDDCIVMNPPFHPVQAPSWSTLFTGKVNAAALFLEKALAEAVSGTTIGAIVPEAIRSGSRYEKLRRAIASRAVVHSFTAEGRFSHEADVDVAILVFTLQDGIEQQHASTEQTPTIGGICDVRVGTVVPHRPTFQHEKRLYVDASDAPVWQEVVPTRRSNHAERAFEPPFVVVRRTSSPSDRKRARASLIRGDSPVLVENHLIVLLPHSPTLKACRALIKILKDSRTDEWLNSNLRCRHLTVGSIKRIPIWPGDQP